jgi:signal recognition particle receptor subunit beta
MKYVVLVTGPFNSGKSTFVRTLGGRFSTDALIGNPVKSTTTVFMDFGTIEHNSYHVTLFGTPGQPKFRMGLMTLKLDAIIVLVDCSDPVGLVMGRGFYQMVRRARPDVPLLVAANKSDRVTARKPEEVRRILGVEEGVPVVPCVATDRKSALEVLERALGLLK